MIVEAVTLIGWFVSPNISKLNKWALKHANNTYKWHRGLKEKLQELARDLQEISNMVNQSGMRFIGNKDGIDHLWRLKDAIHGVEEIVDSFEYEILEADLKRYGSARKTINSSAEFFKQFIGTKDSLSQFEKVVTNLRNARLRTRELIQDSHLYIGSCNTSSISRTRSKDDTSEYPVKDKDLFFGYNKEYAHLISKLRDPKDDLVVIAILGHGGIGKTELARQAFRDVKSEFGLHIWIHAYNKFNKADLLREICGSIRRASPAVPNMSVPVIQQELQNRMASKRCLLVLDDICHDESATGELERKQAWEEVLDPFKRFGGNGSRILVTSRAKICSTTLKVASDASIILGGIDDQAMTLLLKKTVFGDQHARLSLELQQVFEDNVGKLHGSPLAAKAVGLDLTASNRSSTHKWMECLNRNHHDSVVLRHLCSYHDIPPQLQRCFAFCSIFPNNWRFEPEKLTKMWIAHGFVEETERPDGKSMEDVARGYFKDLVDRSLFQEEKEEEEEAVYGGEEEEAVYGGDEETNCYYVIHEQIHSMIRQVAANDCMSIAGGKRTIPSRVRHLSVTGGCLGQLEPESADGLKNVRTLLVLNDDPPPSTSSPLNAIDSGVLKRFKGVRVLDLTETCITQLPESVGELKHVRYIGLPYTMRNPCNQVTRLLLLQTYCVSKTCPLDIVLKKKKKKKKCLLQMSPKDVSRLTNIRHLDVDIDCSAGKGKERNSISGLAAMNSLGGTLSIKGLQTVAGNDEAKEAGLASKGSVKVLKLEWSPPDPRQVGPTARSSAAAADVLGGLQPHPNLKELLLNRYPGTTPPTWLMDSSVLENLTNLYLWNFRNLPALPAVGGLPHLKLLDIKEMPLVDRIDHNFCGSGDSPFKHLEKIVLNDMRSLVAWDAMPVVFPELREVRISNCPMLSSLSGLACCRDSLSCLYVNICKEVTGASMPPNFTRNGFPSLVECTPQLLLVDQVL